MANDRAVPDGLNSYECFGPSADEHSIIPSRLPYKFLIFRFFKKPPFAAYLIAAFAAYDSACQN